MTLKMFNIIKKFILVLINSKFSFSLEKKNILVYDKTSSDEFKDILENKDVFILKTRTQDINKIYISKKIVFLILKNLFRYKIRLNYYIALISEINPEIVITRIDNSPEFYELAKYFLNKIKFISVQNATRGDLFDEKKYWNKNIIITNYVCFSKFDIKAINSLGINVKKFFIGGSLRNSNFKIQSKEKSLNKSNKYDICFISKQDFAAHEGEENRRSELLILLKYLATYVKKFNKKIIIATKVNFNKTEEEIYKNFFFDTPFTINWRTNKFTSYEAISRSKIVVGLSSTILREAFQYETKVLCCEFRKRPNHWDPFSNLNHLKNITYKNFEKRLVSLFNMNINDYYNQLDNHKDYYMANIDTNELLKNLIHDKDQLI